jgi:hypothetical protein
MKKVANLLESGAQKRIKLNYKNKRWNEYRKKT